MWNFMMHLHPLLFLGGFMLIVPGIYIAIATTIVLTRPAAQPQPHAMEVSPWLLAWLTGEGTRVIQLAMFSLLSKKSLWIPEPGQVLANGRYANHEMNVIESILFDHFALRKPCHADLPCGLSIAGRNLWQEQIASAGLALSPLRRGWNMLAISIPSVALGVIVVSKTFIWLDLTAYSIFSCLLMPTGCVLWGGLWIEAISKTIRLDICGISHHDAHACIDALREALAQKGAQEDDATAMLCVAVNGVESLPERYREYKALIAPISAITSLRTED
ncbi:TPA: TIGR04222 domain-containing membrane protein [Klebsiella quasipneumoniae subsp. similipneumoniae]|nr:TIGR04222 domain-containing membrane protein [Klebsiella quasipneumoniae subsp. similipneumoniae]